MKKAALYVRVSTAHQIDKDSLPFQRQELTNYSKYALGIDDFEIFEDAGYSAKNTDRPKYQEMMSRIRNKEFSHILVWKIDRISRNLRDFSEMYDELKVYNIAFISKNEQFDTSSAMGEAMLKIILVFAELERKLTGERVFSIMLSRAEKGLWNGATPPIGYKSSLESKFPEIDDKEARIVQYIYKLYENTASTSSVAFQLNSELVKTKRDGKWTAKTVGDILHNPFYIGTYRYNVKTSGKRRWKDEKEWVVVEDNHPAIISIEQFNHVNEMLTANYKGNGEFQRSSINIHIFSKMLYCGKCGSSFNAGLDVARKDGYSPSRYTCHSNHFNNNLANCNNFVSDITLMPFILNYVSNFINLQSKITQKHSPRDIERILLRGNAFADTIGIDKKGLQDTYIAFIGSNAGQSFEMLEEGNENPNLEFENLKKEKQKFEKALTRLEDLFLYSEESMSQKDFLFKKRDITQNIERINNDMATLNKTISAMNITTDVSFLNKSSNFMVAQELAEKRNIDYRELLEIVGNTLLRDFIQTIISKIVIVDKHVHSITFQNGITHNFLYKAKEQQKIGMKEKLLYLTYEPKLLEYLEEHKSICRKEVEELTGLGRTGAGSIIKEFIDRDILEKKGNSIAIRYFLKEKKTT